MQLALGAGLLTLFPFRAPPLRMPSAATVRERSLDVPLVGADAVPQERNRCAAASAAHSKKLWLSGYVMRTGRLGKRNGHSRFMSP
jgi:hypothetical protein